MEPQSACTTESPASQRVPGIELINALKIRAYDDGLTIARLLSILGISRSYWLSLGYGQRFVSGMSRKVLQACADYLAVPYINVLLLAEIVTPADFVRGADANYRADLTRAMAFISTDPKLQGLATDWQRLDNAALLLIVQLYEKATGTNLLSRSVDVMDGIKSLIKDKH